MSKYFIANWKSHKNQAEAMVWLDDCEHWLTLYPGTGTKIVVAPPLHLMSPVSQYVMTVIRNKVQVAAQDVSPFPAGAYTGEVNAHQWAEIGVKWGLVGHSERREYFGETHQTVANKVALLLEQQITPIVCVDDEYIEAQAAALEPSLLTKCFVAYEDRAAIGTGHNTDSTAVQTAVQKIKETWGDVPVLYGGSVSAENATEYLRLTDGVLVGTHSLESSEFLAIVQQSLTL